MLQAIFPVVFPEIELLLMGQFLQTNNSTKIGVWISHCIVEIMKINSLRSTLLPGWAIALRKLSFWRSSRKKRQCGYLTKKALDFFCLKVKFKRQEEKLGIIKSKPDIDLISKRLHYKSDVFWFSPILEVLQVTYKCFVFEILVLCQIYKEQNSSLGYTEIKHNYEIHFLGNENTHKILKKKMINTQLLSTRLHLRNSKTY